MDNEKAKIDWMWIAGFFEGEGHIYWQEKGIKNSRKSMCGRLIIGQKDKRPLQAIYDFLLQQDIKPPQFYLRPAGKNSRSSPIWMLSVSSRADVITMLEAMRPALFQKADKADMVLARLRQAIVERDVLLDAALAMKADGASWYVVCREFHVKSVVLRNHARTKNITISHPPEFKNEREWRRDRRDRGLCTQCGKERGKFGTHWFCCDCAAKHNKSIQLKRQLFGRVPRTAEQKAERKVKHAEQIMKRIEAQIAKLKAENNDAVSDI